MTTLDHPYVEKRSAGRRREDILVRDMNDHYKEVFSIGQTITSEINMELLFEVIIAQTNEILDTERSTVFLHDEKNNSLWSLVATGLKKDEIRIPTDFGVAGWVFNSRTPLVINDSYKDSRFYPYIDRMTGFRTRKILCIPLINREKECIGTLEALNKRSGDFTDHDVSLLTAVSHYITIALENARLYEELKVVDKAKERVINHLSHELTTPVAIIAGALGQISKDLRKGDTSRIERIIRRGFRNVARLEDLKIKTDDIINMRALPDKGKISGIIEDALNFVEEQQELDRRMSRESLLEGVSRRLDALFLHEEGPSEKIFLPDFLNELCEEVDSTITQRAVNIVRILEKGLILYMDKNVLKKVCVGFLKNAVENTPDEGKVEIFAGSDDERIEIDVCDYGVGISPENQKMIFGGFFHTQDTSNYASKKPYEFNAGGTGADLLRTKVFSERYGFSVDFSSTRCKAIPGDSDICPGVISACDFVKSESECFSSGGSTFSVRFPKGRFGAV